MADVSPAVRVNFLMEEEYFKDSTYLEDVYKLRFPNEFMLQLLENGLFASRQYEWAIESMNNSTIYEECLTTLKEKEQQEIDLDKVYDYAEYLDEKLSRLKFK